MQHIGPNGFPLDWEARRENLVRRGKLAPFRGDPVESRWAEEGPVLLPLTDATDWASLESVARRLASF